MGAVTAIFIAESAGAKVMPIESAFLRAGAGIDGDRYERSAGTYSDWPKDHELTLIEAAVEAEEGLAPGEARRNLLVEGIALNPLVGRKFRIGGVLCEGTRLCEPCAHLETMLERPGLVRRLVGRAGLRARVLEDGEIRVGDAICEE